MVISSINTVEEFTKLQREGRKLVVFFWAKWQEQSKPGSQIYEIFSALSEKFSDINFFTVEAEEVHSVSNILGITVVPTFCSIVGSNTVSKLEGIFPTELSALVKQLRAYSAPALSGSTSTEESSNTNKLNASSSNPLSSELTNRLEKLIRLAPVMLFMKGTPDQPRCGFSRQTVEILVGNDIQFASFDILSDEGVRAGLKVYSDWPTYPQVYVNGALVGGLDILKDMLSAGGASLKVQLGITDVQLPPPPSSLEEKLRGLIQQAPVMLFMKGSPDTPKCGFSRSIVELLRKGGVTFSSFDILTDEEVRAGLKTFSDWPTYPQLYVKGTLVGGLDILREMANSEEDLSIQLGIN
eukprot:gene32705-42352_t